MFLLPTIPLISNSFIRSCSLNSSTFVEVVGNCSFGSPNPVSLSNSANKFFRLTSNRLSTEKNNNRLLESEGTMTKFLNLSSILLSLPNLFLNFALQVH